MPQRIILDSNCSCPCGSESKYTKPINYTDDFKLTYNFIKEDFNPPFKLPLESFNIYFTFYTDGREETYEVSKVGNNCINCRIDPDNSKIKCIFSNHGLQPGYLMMKVRVDYFDPDYPDKMCSITTTKFTNIILRDL